MMEYQDDTGTLLEWGDNIAYGNVMEECVEEVDVVGLLQERSALKPVSR
jgi:hypothetical protein